MGNVAAKGNSSNAEDSSQNKKNKYNILILGLSGSGKTTLLYHNIIPEWKDITSSMEPTISYHYEEIDLINRIVGFWDMSGNPIVILLKMRDVWSLIYRNVNVNAIIYVVNIMDTSDEVVSENNKWIRFLLNDECLQASCVILIFNTFNDVNLVDEHVKNEVLIKYKIKNLNDDYGNRFHHIFVDCKNCKADVNWVGMIEQIAHYF